LNFELKLPIPKIPGLGFKGLEFDSLGHMGLRGLEFESLIFREGLGFEALVLEMHQIQGVVSEVLGLRRSWVSVWVSNCWAHIKLIYGPTEIYILFCSQTFHPNNLNSIYYVHRSSDSPFLEFDASFHKSSCSLCVKK
jgi:hypothetical protein